MPRITPVHWTVLECVFEQAGFTFERQVGSHRSYSKPGVLRPIVIPAHNKDIDVTIIRGLMQTAGMSRDEYFMYLRRCNN